jgi:aspartate kinase
MGWIVQKFGGTSVGKFAEKIAEDVVGYHTPSPFCAEELTLGKGRICLRIGLRWYVRHGALPPRQREPPIGMSPIQSGALICRLLRAAEEAMAPGSTTHIEIVNTIRLDHIQTAQKLICDKEILGRVEREIEFECKRLEDFLNAAQVCFPVKM